MRIDSDRAAGDRVGMGAGWGLGVGVGECAVVSVREGFRKKCRQKG